MKKLFGVLLCVASVAFVSSCGSKTSSHGAKMEEQMREVVDVVKSVSAAKPEMVAEATDEALIKIEKIGTRMKELKLEAEGKADFTAEERKAYEAEVAKIGKELELEMKELTAKHPDIALRLNAKIVEVMGGVQTQ